MKLLKWIIGLLAGIGSLVALFGGSNKKVKELKKKVKASNEKVKNTKKSVKKVEKKIKNDKKKVSDLKKKKKSYKKKNVGADEAADFLKKYSKKGKK
tara:strand:+ start:71 stop:361 length:291 start_codon:yes stop_codon:yes gene_type:complete